MTVKCTCRSSKPTRRSRNAVHRRHHPNWLLMKESMMCTESDPLVECGQCDKMKTPFMLALDYMVFWVLWQEGLQESSGSFGRKVSWVLWQEGLLESSGSFGRKVSWVLLAGRSQGEGSAWAPQLFKVRCCWNQNKSFVFDTIILLMCVWDSQVASLMSSPCIFSLYAIFKGDPKRIALGVLWIGVEGNLFF